MEPAVIVASMVPIALAVINLVVLYFVYLSIRNGERRDFQPVTDPSRSSDATSVIRNAERCSNKRDPSRLS